MKKIGKQSLRFDNAYIESTSTVAGKLEKEGPLGAYFDKTYSNNYCNMKSWEKAEMKLFDDSINVLLDKTKKKEVDISLFIGGDLNNQIVISNYVLKKYPFPHLGIYSACSTITEGLIIGSICADSGLNNIIVGTSSHNATSERQFRNPTEYGGQKNQTTTFTATGAGCALLSNKKNTIRVTKATIGKVIDSTLLDASDMGRVMAFSAADTLLTHLKDFGISEKEYDFIVTGDLSTYGKKVFLKVLEENNIRLNNYEDTGLMLYDVNRQPVFSGGSGTSCIALVGLGFIYKLMQEEKLNKVLFIATGALLNPIMTFQKETIPAISHAVVLERVKI